MEHSYRIPVAERQQPARLRTAGFRFSAFDAMAMVLFAAASATVWQISRDLALALPIVLGHFFLFCNVFRIPPRPELIWSAVFLLNCATWWLASKFSWGRVLLLQCPVTAFLILQEMRRSTYHGIFARQVNKDGLDGYLRGE